MYKSEARDYYLVHSQAQLLWLDKNCHYSGGLAILKVAVLVEALLNTSTGSVYLVKCCYLRKAI
jgi:hypothetical protein